MKSVQIPYDLFIDLAMYHLRGEDDFEEEIRQGLEKKLDAMLNRQLYSQYKTAPTEEQREQARQEYLDRRGVPRLLPFFFVGSGFVPGIELPVQHGVELLLQALPDFFVEIIITPQMVHGEVDEKIIGYLYAFHFPILSYPRRSQRLRRLL